MKNEPKGHFRVPVNPQRDTSTPKPVDRHSWEPLLGGFVDNLVENSGLAAEIGLAAMGALHRQDAEKLLAAGPIIGLLDAPRGRDYPTTLFSAPAAAARLRSPRDQAADFSVPPLRAVKSINCLPKNSAKFGLAGLHNGHATKPRRNRRRRMLCPFFLKCSIRF